MANQLEFEATIGADQVNRLLRDLRNNAEGAAKAVNDAFGGSVTKRIFFETRTDETGAKRLVAVEKERLSITDRIINAQRQLDKTQEGSVTSLRQQVNQLKQQRDGIAKYVGDLRSVNPEWAAVNQQLAIVGRRLDVASASTFWDKAKTGLRAEGLISFSNGLVQITQGFQAASIAIGSVIASVNQFIGALAGIQSFSLAFKAIGVGTSGATLALSESSRIALNLGTDLNTVRDGFRQLTPVILNSGGRISDVSNIVETLSSRFAAFGVSGDKARRVTNGIIQAFAKGKLQAEELTQQISEADPAFKTDFAGALGVSVKKLEELVKAGQINSSVLLETLPKLSKSSLLYGKLGNSATDATDALANGTVTIDQVRSKIQSLGQLSLEQFAKTLEPALYGFIRLQAVVTDFISNLSKTQAAKAFADTIGLLVSSGGKAIEIFLKLSETILAVISPIASLISAITKIPGAVEVLGAVILAKAIAPLGQLGGKFIKTAASSSTFFAAISKNIGSFQGLGQAIGVLAGRSSNTGTALNKLTKSQDTLSRASSFVNKEIGNLSGTISTLQQKQKALSWQGVIIGSSQAANQSKLLQGQIDAATNKLNRYEEILPKIDGRLNSTSQKITTLGASATASSNLFEKFGGSIKNFGTVAADSISKAGTAVGAFLVRIGPIGIALAAVTVAFAAYSNANEQARIESDKSAQSLQAYQKLLQELGSTKPQTPDLSPIQKAWEYLSLEVADAVDSAINVLNKFGSFASQYVPRIKSLFDGLPASLNLAFEVNPLTSPIVLWLKLLGDTGTETDLSIRKFGRGAREVFNGVGQDASKILELTDELKRLQAESDGSSDSQVRLSNAVKNGSDLIAATRLRYEQAVEAIKQFKENEKNLTTEKGRQELVSLQAAAAQAKANLDAATNAFQGFIASSNQLSTEKILQATLSMGALEEQAKSLKGQLTNLVPDSAGFRAYTVDLAALEASISRIQNMSKDPIYVLSLIDDREIEKTKQYNEAIQKLNQLSANPKVDASQVETAKQKVTELSRDLDNLSLLRRELQLKLKVDTIEYDNKIKQLKLQQKIIALKAGISFDNTELLSFVSRIGEIKREIDDLNSKKLEIQTKLDSGALTQQEILTLTREQSALALQIENSTKAASTELANTAQKLVADLRDARLALLNTKVSGLKFLRPDKRQAALAELDNRVKEIANREDMTVTFRGTTEEIIRLKQEFVNFYDQLYKAEDRVTNLQKTLNSLPEVIKYVTESGFNKIFEQTATSVDSIATGLNTIKATTASLPEIINTSSTAMSDLNSETSSVAKELENANAQINQLSSTLQALDGLTVNVNVQQTPARWTGGPVTSGTSYRVNELGTEGFLSNSGNLSIINRPRNSMWRAPSTGTVIPAHIMKDLQASSNTSNGPNIQTAFTAAKGDFNSAFIKGAQFALSKQNANDSISQLAATQAGQAAQIGRLSRAVDGLVAKDWNVNVQVRSNGGTAYLDALNRRL